ncbi:hypothetical protein SARC_01313 [Sphaeroforma arctica JP610]|uniref:Uncharacterized protein n=1 Tax=Sphaeroforma arctica JP610 TaxID=667725 RepID=A0A0L0GC21_9EUKA|nr:hypothetical protein SARC_01313 [Sphaeroforma arctica JP610]KNC86540.1 hypothetical protein SARC_01313 [Sphaeroforma arctica JP610]|eukprot:XP_014160442.1 hypothetical protein SARC_01313 [Sphaeroforma arctica JP610]
MSYDEPTTYLIALDPEESNPSTIVHSAHAVGRDHDGRKTYDRRIDKSGPRHDMSDYRYMSKNSDKHSRSDSNRGYRTREERYNSNNRYQYRYDSYDDND